MVKGDHKEVIAAMKATIPWLPPNSAEHVVESYKKLMNKRKAARRALRAQGNPA